MKITRIGDVQNSLIRLILWQVGKEPITDRHLRAAKDHFNNECAYCGEKKDLDFDHAVPINKTSLGQQRVGNLVPSCTDCNQKKGQRHFNDYLSSDPDGDIRISRILKYMQKCSYTPLGNNENIKALLENARKEVAAVADKHIAAVNKLLAESPTMPSPSPEFPAAPVLCALPSVVSDGSNAVNGSPYTDTDLAKICLAKIYDIKRRMNRSWLNLRRGCLDQMGVSVPHGTPKVGASSRAFAKRSFEATGLNYPEIVALLDQHFLGLDPKH